MSKSLGTGIDPLDEIDRHGADAVRFGLLAMSSTQDVRYSAEKVEQGQALANKLFNASRYVLLTVAEGGPVTPAPRPRTVEDRWILSRLQRVTADTPARIEGFDFAKAALGLYDFVYGELCDWYLELIKARETDEDLSATLLHVLRETLAVAHPLIPFVTEELWAEVPGDASHPPLLAAARYPRPDESLLDERAEHEIQAVIGAVTAVRAFRNDAGVKPGQRLPARLAAEGYAGTAPLVARLGRLDLEAPSSNGADPAAVVPIPGGALEVLPAEGVDLAEADRRRDAERERVRAEIARAEGKLANQGFVAKAPDAVVRAERDKLERLRRELEAL
jgi:valyl-tRNA synthetase